MADAIVRHARREGVCFPEFLNLHPTGGLTTQSLDAPIILSLIQELADYERESDAVKATVETLQNTIAFAPSDAPIPNTSSVPNTEPTSPSRPARCLLLSRPEDGETVGMALYFYNYSTWRSRPGIYLEDLYVRPTERNKGYGKRLLSELAKEVIAMDGGRLEWVVLKWNEPSIKFYESIGAVAMHDWVGMRVDGAGLEKLARVLEK
ncbi:N-acetyltransferase ats1 [Paramyrothecium foliicola]|nr:N-acetyltransferase ats1 [Paramyrothecium foliicola]